MLFVLSLNLLLSMLRHRAAAKGIGEPSTGEPMAARSGGVSGWRRRIGTRAPQPFSTRGCR